jgi:hypothetical protein
MTVCICIQLLALKHCRSISNGSCLTTLLTALISLQVTTTCLLTWRIGWDHSALTVVRGWWKVSKHDWAHRLQASLIQAYKNVFPDNTSASVLALTMLRSSWSIYVFFVYNNFFLIACFVNSSPKVAIWIALVHIISHSSIPVCHYCGKCSFSLL